MCFTSFVLHVQGKLEFRKVFIMIIIIILIIMMIIIITIISCKRPITNTVKVTLYD